MLSPAQIAAFRDRGLVRVDGLLPAAKVRVVREALHGALAARGLWRDGVWRGDRQAPPSLNVKELGRPAGLDALIQEPAVRAAVAALAEGVRDDALGHVRPQVLFTPPNAATWQTPHGMWHLDFPRLARDLCPGVQIFAFLDAVDPGGGGTLVVAGSHRLANVGRFIRSRDVKEMLRGEPFFRALFSRDGDRARFLGAPGAAGGVEVEVVELTGAPGDAWLMDIRMLHTLAPNASDRPRLMLTHRFIRPECVAEYFARLSAPTEDAPPESAPGQ